MDAQWDSKWFNLGDSQEVKILRELVAFARTEGDHSITARVRTDFSTSSGSSSTMSLLVGGSLYGSAIYGTSTYSASPTLLFNDLESVSQDAFRFIQIRISNSQANEPFRIERVIINAKPIGRRWVHNGA